MNSPVAHAAHKPLSAGLKESGFTVTIVICTRDRPDHLGQCLEAVAALNPPPNDVMVIDNSAGDKRTESIARKFSARYIVERNLGLSHARNRGLEESNTEIVAYLDDDAQPERHWLDFLLRPFTDPLVASVTGRSVVPGTVISELRDEPSCTISNQDPQWFERASFGGTGNGNNMALRRDPCTGKAIFDVRLGRGAPIRTGEEHHAFASLLARGYRTVHAPDAIVFHPVRPSDIEQQTSNLIAYWLLLFFEFPSRRVDLLRFLVNRLRRKPLSWPRENQHAGYIVSSGWRVYCKAAFRGGLLFLRAMQSK